MSERRKASSTPAVETQKPTSLPGDYLKMVQDVLSATFAKSLEILKSGGARPRIEMGGEIYADEIVLRASLLFEGQLAATTVFVSSDFDPAASSPKLEELLGSCVDALGAVFTHLLDPTDRERLEQLQSDSLAALEEIPFEWSPTEINRREVFVRVDKSNPGLDRMADEWLAKNDPESRNERESEEQDSEELLEDRIEQIKEDKGRRGGGDGPTFH